MKSGEITGTELAAAAILPVEPTSRNAAAVTPADNPPPHTARTQPGGYVMAGGGTGGHLFPALAVAHALRARDPECGLLFAGTDRPHERAIVAPFGFDHLALPLLPRHQMLRHPIRLTASLWDSCRRMRRLFRDVPPRMVIGLGGWSSFPSVWAARRLGIPIVLLEQNVLPGKATRWLSRWADRVCLSFEESRLWLPRGAKSIVTGNPVRAEIAALATRDIAPHSETDRPLLLILGGSLGSGFINRELLRGLSDLEQSRRWEVVHQTGAADCETVRAEYRRLGLDARVEPFLIDIPALLARASLVVSRAGATTLAELACAGAAAAIVPWKQSANNHQQLNAEWYADRNAIGLATQDHDQLWLPVWIGPEHAAARSHLRGAIRELARPTATPAVLDVLDSMEPARAR